MRLGVQSRTVIIKDPSRNNYPFLVGSRANVVQNQAMLVCYKATCMLTLMVPYGGSGGSRDSHEPPFMIQYSVKLHTATIYKCHRKSLSFCSKTSKQILSHTGSCV